MVAIEKFVAESDRRKEIAKIRLKESQEELGEEAAKKMQKLNEVDEEIAQKLAKAEEYGSEGDADNSLKMMEEVDELKEKKKEMEVGFCDILFVFRNHCFIYDSSFIPQIATI